MRLGLIEILSGSLGKDMFELIQANPDETSLNEAVKGYIDTRLER